MSKFLNLFLLVICFVQAIFCFSLKRDQAKRQTSYSLHQWKGKFMNKFTNENEQSYRDKIYLQNLRVIEQHNSNPERTYDMGVNQFSMMSKEQYMALYLLQIPQSKQIRIESQDNYYVANDIDWEADGAVTHVKSQGPCRATYAFATTGTLEGLSKIGYGKLSNFSQQQIIDCSKSYSNNGCTSGSVANSLSYVKDHGISLQTQYPYKNQSLPECQKNDGQFKISGYTQVKNCNDLAAALVHRPIAVAVDASNWYNYHAGVFKNCTTKVNYYALLTGMTSTYWRIKNSVGTFFGEQGYIRIASGNTCGVCSMGFYPNK